MWRRVNRYWKVLLAAYPFLMMFSLAYGGDHYVVDGIAGALCAWFVHWGIGRIERRRRRRTLATTLESLPDQSETADSVTEQQQEIECPPSSPQPATTPSST
jgi:membrane-associated phospholipid phosphatase